jgi:AbrB family looped-hinge helix DNA binding protein
MGRSKAVRRAKITSKGQITIPKEVREALGVDVGDSVQFVFQDNQTLLRPIKKRSLTGLYGVFAGDRDNLLAKRVRELAARYSGQDLVREVKRLEREIARKAAVERKRRVSQR